MAIHDAKSEIVRKIMGKSLNVGEFHGKIVSVNDSFVFEKDDKGRPTTVSTLTLKNDAGQTKTVAINKKRLNQLLTT